MRFDSLTPACNTPEKGSIIKIRLDPVTCIRLGNQETTHVERHILDNVLVFYTLYVGRARAMTSDAVLVEADVLANNITPFLHLCTSETQLLPGRACVHG